MARKYSKENSRQRNAISSHNNVEEKIVFGVLK